MDFATRIENALLAAIEPGESAGCPPGLAAAIRYAVFPGGARVRPRLCLAVASACGDPHPRIADAAAASIELLHCASLMHDDLPCFDDATTRRGKPAVHRTFGERLAVLGGDAMIVLAFESLADACGEAPERLPLLLKIIGRSVGTSGGIVAGQAWECEPRASLTQYQQAKTGSLFAAATMAGAAAVGEADSEAWRALGEKIGEAYQVADDILDVTASASEIGKPVGRDAALGRPSVVALLGLDGAIASLKRLVAEATDSIPAIPAADALRAVIFAQAQGLLPRDLRQAA
ncbi:MAG: polyprenyl synthetase family protein [Dokdonella sp.]|uniref:polyprenyl synthetase family protein n=1 Tax=Dokdonella sp. TaxID=2291710 RepID=UPI003267B5B2